MQRRASPRLCWRDRQPSFSSIAVTLDQVLKSLVVQRAVLLCVFTRVRFAFPVILSMCELQGKTLEMSTPKYWSLPPGLVHVVDTDNYLGLTLTTLHFEGLNVMFHLDSHTDRVSRSFWSTRPLPAPSIVR